MGDIYCNSDIGFKNVKFSPASPAAAGTRQDLLALPAFLQKGGEPCSLAAPAKADNDYMEVSCKMLKSIKQYNSK